MISCLSFSLSLSLSLSCCHCLDDCPCPCWYRYYYAMRSNVVGTTVMSFPCCTESHTHTHRDRDSHRIRTTATAAIIITITIVVDVVAVVVITIIIHATDDSTRWRRVTQIALFRTPTSAYHSLQGSPSGVLTDVARLWFLVRHPPHVRVEPMRAPVGSTWCFARKKCTMVSFSTSVG